jgi:SEFIR domain
MPTAPRVFISYSHDSPPHMDRILDLSDALRAKGIDCSIDQYEQSPAEGWPQWCANQVKQSQFVLVACTETYQRRFNGEEAPGTGLGGTWEGHIITQALYNAQGRNTKFLPICFSSDDREFVPEPLQSATLYQLPDQYDALYRHLTDQPLISKPPLGGIETRASRPAFRPQPLRQRKENFQKLWLVPYPRNPFFTGRGQALVDLQQALAKRKSAALSGLGGLGKTQTAVEYAYRHRADYAAIFWIRAETRELLLADLAALAAPLNLPSAAAKEQEAAVAEVRQWLEANPGWLLILDNLDDLGLAKGILPRDSEGHLLLTTRARALGGLAERIDLDEMQPEEGALLLLRRAKLIDAANQADQFLTLSPKKFSAKGWTPSKRSKKPAASL